MSFLAATQTVTVTNTEGLASFGFDATVTVPEGMQAISGTVHIEQVSGSEGWTYALTTDGYTADTGLLSDFTGFRAVGTIADGEGSSYQVTVSALYN